ncbi:hypothetical protein ASD00_03835 [Ensifer sp. Root31]|nr:hypothetical protein ASD00_03835 [Ensifer sp. Root31]
MSPACSPPRRLKDRKTGKAADQRLLRMIVEHGSFSIGISARNLAGDLSDLGEEFYMIEALSVDLI